jgi:NADH-quinone oxidoreductase subunit F
MTKAVDLQARKELFGKAYQQIDKRIIVCAGTGCIANGSMKIHDKMIDEISAKGLNVDVELHYEKPKDGVLMSKSGCQGFCQVGPLITILPDNIMYCHVKEADVERIVDNTIINDEIIDDLLYEEPSSQQHYKGVNEIPFYTRQKRTVIKNCGFIDPEDITEYIALNGYEAARQAYLELQPAEVCRLMKESGLRGRGGGGFSTGFKWELTLANKSDKKYVICNGDEGDPGAFMDRSILEGNPHSVIEGMLLAAKAIEADEGYVYVRVEYPLAVKRMRKAIADAEAMGILGKNVFGSGQDFFIQIKEGAGAFVCGEETALIASVEGKRGMPIPKPPFPAEKGLFGKPTVINNVETLAAVPQVMLDGPAKFRELGTEKSPGTKTFALTGNVANTGLIEVPFGTTVREIVFDIGGGVINDRGEIDNDDFKLCQIGGPSGGCLTEEHLDIPLDFDSLKSIGAMVGSGGLVVMNKSACIVQVAKFFMQFTQNESCGKCIPCREGTKQMLELLNDIIAGEADLHTLDLLEKTARTVQKASLCGLGKSAPSPVLSTLKYFREEYEMHVKNKTCMSKQCTALTCFEIEPELCKGCTLCARACPVDAIVGEVRKVHEIDQEKCIKCGACVATCKFNAITGGA